jgi:hypothetical protein
MGRTSKLLQYLASDTLYLWLLLVVCSILYAGRLLGLEWNLGPANSFGRLLRHPGVAGSEVLMAIALLLLVHFNRSKPSWALVAIAVAAAIMATYHMFYFLVGTEFLLLLACGAIAREYARLA